MGGPGWLSGTFAALMLTVAAYCAGRLMIARRRRRPTELDTDLSHVLMGLAMAGMLVTGLRTLPGTLWEGVFAAGAAWFGGQTLRARRGTAASQASQASPWRCPQPGPHAVECAAMLYMFLAVPATPAVKGVSMAGHASAFSVLALLMALFLVGHVARVGDRATPAGGCGQGRALLAPRCATLCKIAMGLTMGYMLILTV